MKKELKKINVKEREVVADAMVNGNDENNEQNENTKNNESEFDGPQAMVREEPFNVVDDLVSLSSEDISYFISHCLGTGKTITNFRQDNDGVPKKDNAETKGKPLEITIIGVAMTKEEHESMLDSNEDYEQQNMTKNTGSELDELQAMIEEVITDPDPNIADTRCMCA